MTTDEIRRIFKMRNIIIVLKYLYIYTDTRPMTSDAIRRKYMIN